MFPLNLLGHGAIFNVSPFLSVERAGRSFVAGVLRLLRSVLDVMDNPRAQVQFLKQILNNLGCQAMGSPVLTLRFRMCMLFFSIMVTLSPDLEAASAALTAKGWTASSLEAVVVWCGFSTASWNSSSSSLSSKSSSLELLSSSILEDWKLWGPAGRARRSLLYLVMNDITYLQPSFSLS